MLPEIHRGDYHGTRLILRRVLNISVHPPPRNLSPDAESTDRRASPRSEDRLIGESSYRNALLMRGDAECGKTPGG